MTSDQEAIQAQGIADARITIRTCVQFKNPFEAGSEEARIWLEAYASVLLSVPSWLNQREADRATQ